MRMHFGKPQEDVKISMMINSGIIGMLINENGFLLKEIFFQNSLVYALRLEGLFVELNFSRLISIH